VKTHPQQGRCQVVGKIRRSPMEEGNQYGMTTHFFREQCYSSRENHEKVLAT